jgi:hypothetical protein
MIVGKYSSVNFFQNLNIFHHFSKQNKWLNIFPEHKNIRYTNDNKCHFLENNLWKEKDPGLLSRNLMKDDTEVLLLYCDKEAYSNSYPKVINPM